MLQVNEMHLSKKPKIFYKFFIAFPESTSYFQYFESKMSLRAEVIPNLLTPKYLLNFPKGYVLGHSWTLNLLTGTK